MTLYLDKFNGVWELSDDHNETHRWALISSNNNHDIANTVRGSGQNDATMQEEFAPLVAIETGEEYNLSPVYRVGDHAWVYLDDIVYSSEFPTYNGERDEVLVSVAGPGDTPDRIVVQVLIETDKSTLNPYITNEHRS